jgi:PI-3-kinase-related kinase SMG-1
VIKSIPIVQEVYNNILQDSEICYNTLLKNCSTDQEKIPAEKPTLKKLKGIQLLSNLKYAETSLIFNLCVYRELGNAKNNLICMYALSPTLFELLTGKLSPCNWNLAEYFPNIQYAIFNRLYSHSSRYYPSNKFHLFSIF